MNMDVCAKGEPPLSLKAECKSFHDRRLAQRAADAERLAVPLILSEFGACYDSENCAMEVGLVADACDKHLVSWGYWQFKNYWDLTTSAGTGSEGFYNQDGSLQTIKIEALARAYLPFTQGVLHSMNWNPSSLLFTATFNLDQSLLKPSVLYVPAVFGDDYTVSLTEVKSGYDCTESFYLVKSGDGHVQINQGDGDYDGLLLELRLSSTLK